MKQSNPCAPFVRRARMMISAFAFGLPAVAAAPLAAADLALVLANSDYATAPDLNGARQFREIAATLNGAGFRVFQGHDVTGAEMQRLASLFANAAGDDDGTAHRLVIVLSGHVAADGTGSWLIGRDANRPNAINIGATALPLAPLAQVAGHAQGRAVILLGSSSGQIPVGLGLTSGTVEFPLPQGVTLAEGPADSLLSLLNNGLLVPGTSYGNAAKNAGDSVTFSGFVSPTSGLTPMADQEPAQPDTPTDTGEIAYWGAVRDIGTIPAFEAYLNRYPDGKFAPDARRLITAIREAPVKQAEAIETRLNLTQNQRRTIQRNLALIGFDPRGIDGIFGPATRNAIGAWQQSINQPVTTYLNGPQIKTLQAAADVRAAALEEEAKARREAQERNDRTYWRDLGQGRDEAALRAYLKRYPDGLFADVAHDRLQQIENRRRAEAQRDERLAWETALRQNTTAAYKAFLGRFPNSGFADAARARIEELEEEARNAAKIDAARRQEQSIAGNQVTRKVIEQRLNLVGFDPGPVDGVFDPATRRAIRRFQRDQGLIVTGYVTQETMVRLLAVRN